MNRINQLFSTKQKDILSIYFCAGFPTLEGTASTIKVLEKKGINMIEIGIPFSDHNGYANRYKIECDGLTILDLNAPGYTMLHWLTILLENREFDTSAPLAAEAKEYLMNTFHLDYKSADIIIGYRADDSYFSFASDFINGAISYRQLCNAMRLGKLGQQFVLKSKAAFEQLEFLGYETADSKEWYKKKAFRDQTARRQYFDVERNRRQRGDLYITTILDEEMKPNDPRLR